MGVVEGNSVTKAVYPALTKCSNLHLEQSIACYVVVLQCKVYVQQVAYIHAAARTVLPLVHSGLLRLAMLHMARKAKADLSRL